MGPGLAVFGQTVYAGGQFDAFGGEPWAHDRETLGAVAALDATSGQAMSWNPRPNCSVSSLAPGPEGSLWASGCFTGFPSAPQGYIAKFAP